MSTPRRPAVLGAFLGLALVGITGCADGADEALSRQGFVACAEGAGLSLAGSDDWERDELAEFFSQPQALVCAVDELDDDDRSAVLQEAFPDYEDDQDLFVTRNEAITSLASVDAGDGDDERALGLAATVIDSLEWTEQPDAEGAARRFVVALLEARGELPDLAQVREDGEDETSALYDYGVELEQSTEPVGDRFRDLYYAALDEVGP